MRLIDADELKIKLADELSDALGETDFTDGLHYGLKLAISLAEETPLADAKPIRYGYWLYDRLCSTNGGTYGVQRCSNCGYYYKDFGDEWNYCPHCGAKMDEVEK